MKIMKIAIKSSGEANRDFERAFEAVQKRLGFERQSGVYFTSLEAVRNFLTPKRLSLIRLIKERQPKSIYELAKLAARSFSSVFKDIEILSQHGLVSLTKDRKSPRRSVHPLVPYDAISLCIGF